MDSAICSEDLKEFDILNKHCKAVHKYYTLDILLLYKAYS